MEFTKEFEKTICETYLRLKTVSSVSRELKISRSPVARILQSHGFRKKPEVRELIDDITELKVCEDYVNTFLTEDLIAEKYNICKQSVRNIRKRNGIQARTRPKYKCNHTIKCDDTYFENISNPERAWVLGFIAGDGSITSGHTLEIGLSDKDSSLLEKISKFLKSDHKLVYGENFIDKYNKSYPYCRLRIDRRLLKLRNDKLT